MIKHTRFSGRKKIAVLILIAAIPLLVWAVVTQRYELRRRAASVEPSVCTPVGGMITVTPRGNGGTCWDLQNAIDSAPDGGNTPFTIRLTPGVHVVLDRGNPFSLVISNRQRLTIIGDPEAGTKAVTMSFPGNHGGILVQNSSEITFRFLDISGHTANGLFSIRNSTYIAGADIHLSDTGAHTFDSYGGGNTTLYNCDIRSSAGAIDMGGLSYFTIENCNIHDAANGITINNSTGYIAGNTIHNLSESGIRLANASINLNHNTIVGSGYANSPYHAGLNIQNFDNGTSSATLQNTIIAYNQGYGIRVTDLDSTTISANHNDVFGNSLGNSHTYAFPTGSDGNISANPQFGPEYCLNPGSPALYGSIANNEYMGSRSACAGPTPTPVIDKTACNTDSDCGCALDTVTNSCAIQNKLYLHGNCTAPDFCTGISGRCSPACVQGLCQLACPTPTGPEATPTPWDIPSVTPTPTLPPLADLIITRMQITSQSLFCGDNTLGLRVTFKNQGAAPAWPFTVEANETELAYNGHLLAGAEASLWFPISPLIGQPTTATVDSTGVVTESDESNNTQSMILPIPTPNPSCSPTPTPSTLPGDIVPNGSVDIYDYNQLVTDFGKTGSPGFVPADIIPNGTVDIYDYNVLVENFGRTTPDLLQ